MKMLSLFIIPLLWVVLIDLSAYAAGYACKYAFNHINNRFFPQKPVHVSWLHHLLLGYMLWGILLFLLGIFHLLYPWLLILSVIISACFGAAVLLQQGWDWKMSLEDWRQNIALIIPILFLLFYFIPCFIPSFHHDSMVYHLTIPKLYSEKHAIVTIPYNLFLNMPHFMQLLYTLPFSAGESVSVKLFSYHFNFWIICSFFLFARELNIPYAAALMAVLYLASPEVQWHLPSAHIEPALACYLLFAHLCFVQWLKTKNSYFLFLCFLSIGWLMGCKYTVLYFLWGLILSILCYVGREVGTGKLRLRWIMILLAAWLFPCSLWLAKNWVVTGNPVYPNLYHFFGGRWWFDVQNLQFTRSLTLGAVVHDQDFLWSLVSFLNESLRVFSFYFWKHHPISYVLIALGVCSLFFPRIYRGHHRLILFWALCALLGWRILPTLQVRFFVTILPILILPIGIAFSTWKRWTVLWIALWAVILTGLYMEAQLPRYSWRAFTVQEYERIRSHNYWHYIWQRLERDLIPTSKLFTFFENRTFYSKWDCITDSAYEAPASMAILRTAANTEEIVHRLREDGVTHILMNWKNAELFYWNIEIWDPYFLTGQYKQAEKEKLNNFLNTECRLITDFGDVELYEIYPVKHTTLKQLYLNLIVPFHASGMQIELQSLVHSEMLNFWLDWNDDYEIQFYRDESLIEKVLLNSLHTDIENQVRIPDIPQLRMVKISPENARIGYDIIRILPLRGDGRYFIKTIYIPD